jgi:hypothetical protein
MKLNDYALLETGTLSKKTDYVHPERLPEVVHLDSPATHVMTDFTSRPPVTTKPNTPIKTALEEMRAAHVKSLFVIDEEDKVIGHVSTLDCHGIKPGQVASLHGITPAEVTVSMVMMPVDAMRTLHRKYMDSAKVGHIARLFHELGLNYIIVICTCEQRNDPMICGLFSISRLRRQLGEDIGANLSSSSVADIHRRIPD